ncbi:MAG TPA: peptidoglycan-associated lipoprotein Pal [Chromatiales bacterium]|jgi:peptidoglycan-associated lipoprotein|nr:peptidoglycan-associated lipoprotein Pal [Chromatiales bacterium]
MNRTLKLLLVALFAAVMAGCSGTGGTKSDSSASTGSSSTGGAETNALIDNGSFRGSELDDPNSMLATRVLYFDFDKSNVRSEFNDLLAAHAKYLAANANASIVLEGHADERGSREYNVALSEKRAIAVQQILTVQGARNSQVDVVGYGEERPAASGHDESAWRVNRRVEIVYAR